MTDIEKEEQLTPSMASQLLEKSSPGDCFIIYGDAGMGKTTLLKHFARSWLETDSMLAQKFKFVFLILMRLVGSHTLVDIICDDLGFIPAVCKGRLNESLALHSSKVLFLLDSYEEQPFKRDEVDNLIKGTLFPKRRPTVIVTSRPGSELTELQEKMSTYVTAQLQDLPEENVKKTIECYFDNKEDAHSALQAFPAKSFLQRPINLALFLYIVSRQDILHILTWTQEELFNQILQYIMLAYAKKMRLKEFAIKAGSHLKNAHIPFQVMNAFTPLARKCYEERKRRNVVLYIRKGEQNPVEAFLVFGLFTKGPDANSVVLPHPLFQEHFAACYLVAHPAARDALFHEIKRIAEHLNLEYVVRSVLGMENTIRFLISLDSTTVTARQVGSLFGIRHIEINKKWYQCFLRTDLLLNLLRDCSDETKRSDLLTALLEVPVIVDTCMSQDAKGTPPRLLQYLNEDQMKTLLKKGYNYELCLKGEGKVSTMSQNASVGSVGKWDSYVLALVCKYDLLIQADRVYIDNYDLPVRMLSDNMSGVHKLKLEHCTLCMGIPDYMSDLNTKEKPAKEQQLLTTNSLLESVELRDVKGLQHLWARGPITSKQCRLELYECGDVTLGEIKRAFPRVTWLELVGRNSTMFDTDEQLTTVRTLRLSSCGDVDLLRLLFHTFVQLKDIYVFAGTLQLCNTMDSVKQNNTLSQLSLQSCKGDVDLALLFQTCSQCQQLKDLTMSGCKLQLCGVNDTRDKQNNTLSRLSLNYCESDIDLALLFQTCSQCQQLTDLTVERCELQLCDVSDTSDKQNNTLSRLSLNYCQSDIDLALLFQTCSQCQQLRDLTVKFCEVQLGDVSDTSNKQNNTLSRLSLHHCKSDIDLALLFQTCSQCQQLKELNVKGCKLLVSDSDERSCQQLPTLRKFTLLWGSVHTTSATSGQRLSGKEAKDCLRRLCPASVSIDIIDYGYPDD